MTGLDDDTEATWKPTVGVDDRKDGDGPRSALTASAIPFGRIGVVALVAAVAFSRAAGKRMMRRLRAPDRPLLVCVTVPDRAWFEPLREAAKVMVRPLAVHVWDSTTRRTGGDPSVTEVVGQVAKGRGVLCVSQDVVSAVPRAIRTVADATITLEPPSAADIALAISIVRGGRGPTDVPADLGRGLDLHEVAACLRGGEAPRVMVDRIRRAMVAKGTSGVDLTAPRLEDLRGYGEAADWGKRVVTDVAAFREGRTTWRDVAGAAILHGPPGTGKTLFSRAMARSLSAPLVATSVSAWFQSGAGDLGATVRMASAAFEGARAAVRDAGVAVLFLDEVDSLPCRAALDARQGSWWRPVVNHVLTLVDGATSDLHGVVLIAATNDIASVDPALLRPGRFGTALQVLPPSTDDLAGVMRHHLGGETCPLSVADVAAVLRPTAGATQARAAAWAADAMRRAREADRPVRIEDVVAAVLPPDGRSAAERRRVAVHEAGHAVSAWHLARDRFVSVSIVETADSHGSTTMVVRDDALLVRDEIEVEVTMCLGGRAADVVVGDGANAGAGGEGRGGATSDLALATRMLTDVHATLGLGLTLRHRGHAWPRHDDEVARLVEADLQRLMARAEAFVSAHAAEVEALARALVARGFLTAADIGTLLAGT